MARARIRRVLVLGMLAAFVSVVRPLPGRAQGAKSPAAPVPSQSVVTIEQPDAQCTREELSCLLEHFRRH